MISVQNSIKNIGHAKKQESETHNQEKKQQIEADPQMI